MLIADLEATSDLFGLASAYKRMDWAISEGGLWIWGEADGPDQEVEAEEEMGTYTQSGRLVTDMENEVRAESYVNDATWTASAFSIAARDGDGPNMEAAGLLASVSGETGITFDGNDAEGNPILLPGLGAGAVLWKTAASPATAGVFHNQEAEFDGSWFADDTRVREDFELELRGPPFSGADTGAAGAYGGLGPQSLFIMAPGQWNRGTSASTFVMDIDMQTAIYWMNGAMAQADGKNTFIKPTSAINPTWLGLLVEFGPEISQWLEPSGKAMNLEYTAGIVHVDL
jgi:hypothetical protein